MIQVVGVVAYIFGSQMLNMMPFLQLYPALQCADTQGIYSSCTRDEACLNPNGFAIDWGERISLDNWMTDLNLICSDPAKVGLMGSVAFISVGFGSILLGGLMD